MTAEPPFGSIAHKLLAAAKHPHMDNTCKVNVFVVAEAADLITELIEALDDALSGWRYIRAVHGDLYGVGWDRVEQAAEAALSKVKAQQP